jgi:hypothetical protein
VPEAFEELRVPIHAATLRSRLPATLVVAKERERQIYNASDSEIEGVLQSYRAFVALCEQKKLRPASPVSL